MTTDFQPALALPIGKRDWNNGLCDRLEFMLTYYSELQKYGWTFGVDCKGNIGNPAEGKALDDWFIELAEKVNTAGGKVFWHPSIYPVPYCLEMTETIGQWMDSARAAHEKFNLRWINLHAGAAQYTNPAPNGPDRFNLNMTARELVECIDAHIEPIRLMNERSGEILTIENVHPYLFYEGIDASEYWVYNAQSIGSWYDLVYLKEETGVACCVDIEHYLGANAFYNRYRHSEFENLPVWESDEYDDDDKALQYRADIYVKPGYIPMADHDVDLETYLITAEPKLLHLGTTGPAIVDGLCGDHLEFHIENEIESDLLFMQLVNAEENQADCVIESVSQTEGGFNWSPNGRSTDSNQAKYNSFLAVLKILKELHCG
jgi:hypothetical protein